ncbi:MAG: hypothetical protein SCK29_12055 [Bacillota bacterium]|nr:hypothetical protein [Bacillota bacterium]MDW7684838.1 hypothetical protein [Bacillota bacterium]
MSFYLPCYGDTGNAQFFLRRNEEGALVYSQRTVKEPWSEEKTLLHGCKSFSVTPGKDRILHVIAQDSDHYLLYFLLEEDTVRKSSFLAENAQGPFLTVFSSSGNGYFISATGKSELTTATFSPDGGWRQNSLSVETVSIPLCLAADHMDGIHIIIFDAGEGALSYISCNSSFSAVGSSLVLDTLSELQCPPALWLDPQQNIHIAWYDRGHICYKLKSARGWPAGGWQPDRKFSLDEKPCLLSFHSADKNLSLWAKHSENKVLVVDISGSKKQTIILSDHERQPVRISDRGQTRINLSNPGMPSEWFFTDEVTIYDAPPADLLPREEDDNQLLLHAQRLMAEKKQLLDALSKKEASLAQYRQMLEMTQQNKNKQSAVLSDQLTVLNDKVRVLREELGAKNKMLHVKDEVIKEEQMRYSELKKQLEHSTALYEDSLKKVSALQEQLCEAEDRQHNLCLKIKKVQEELAQKKNVWEAIGDIFHKKTSDKK